MMINTYVEVRLVIWVTSTIIEFKIENSIYSSKLSFNYHFVKSEMILQIEDGVTVLQLLVRCCNFDQ